MTFESTFPQRYLMNLARRQDRRVRCEEIFEQHELAVRRFPAVDALHVKRTRGFEGAGRYAHAVTCRMILRRAWMTGAEAVFLFEDDVVLAPDWRERLAGVELPEDWGIFYLGCQHQVRPEVIQTATPEAGHGLVRVRGALDTHAWGVRRPWFKTVMRALEGREIKASRVNPAADVFLARLHEQVPAYAVFPNLAWQNEEHSDLVKGVFSNYDADGTQRPVPEVMAGLHAEALGGRAWPGAALRAAASKPFYLRHFEPVLPRAPVPAPPPEPVGEAVSTPVRVAFLFLTVGELNHPRVWAEYFAGREAQVSVLAHTKQAHALPEGLLQRSQIPERVETAWGEVSLVQATLAMLRRALSDERNTHFILLSESCVPVKPLAWLERLLRLDGRSRIDWATPEEVAAKNPEKLERISQCPRLAASQWRFHPQWLLLDREAAALSTEDDFTPYFSGSKAADESYFATVLKMKGWSLEEKAVRSGVTFSRWPAGVSRHPVTLDHVTPAFAAELAGSPFLFARKFAPGSNIGEYGLHR